MLTVRKCLFIAAAAMAAGFAAAGIAPAGEGPDRVVLDSLSSLFEGVVFDHAMHETAAQDCAVCHHHTTGSAPRNPECRRCHEPSREASTVSCRECHPAEPFSAEALRDKDRDIRLYHTDTVGLKAAYHLSCTGCHRKAGGPVSCEDCHARTEAGDAFFYAGPYAPLRPSADTPGH